MVTSNTGVIWALVCLLAIGPASGQRLPGQALRVIALEGTNAVNNLPLMTVTPPVIEIRDESEKPIEGATVTFKAPTSGPGATFDGAPSYTGLTDQRGQIGVPSYRVNGKPGRFSIAVTATHEGRSGMLLINQTNSATEIAERKSGKRKWVLIGVAVGVGAGVGIYLGTHGGSPTPISVGTGPVVIGAPR